MDENKKKKSSIGLVFLMIFLLIIGLIGGYFLGKSGIISSDKKNNASENKSSKSNTSKESEEKVEDLDINSSIVTNLFDSITHANRKYCDFYELFKDKKMTANDLTNEDKALVMVYNLFKKYDSIEGKTFTKAEVENVYKQIFGKDVTFEHATYKTCPGLEYDATKEIYTVGPAACGGTCGPHTNGKVISATKTGDIIQLNVGVVFFENETWYADYKHTKSLNVQYDGNGNPNIDYSNVSSYKVIFKFEAGNYVFVSAEENVN